MKIWHGKQNNPQLKTVDRCAVEHTPYAVMDRQQLCRDVGVRAWQYQCDGVVGKRPHCWRCAQCGLGGQWNGDRVVPGVVHVDLFAYAKKRIQML